MWEGSARDSISGEDLTDSACVFRALSVGKVPFQFKSEQFLNQRCNVHSESFQAVNSPVRLFAWLSCSCSTNLAGAARASAGNFEALRFEKTQFSVEQRLQN